MEVIARRGLGARGCRHKEEEEVESIGEDEGVRRVSAACNRDGVAKAVSGLMLPVVWRPSPFEGMFGFPHVGKVLESSETVTRLPASAAFLTALFCRWGCCILSIYSLLCRVDIVVVQ